MRGILLAGLFVACGASWLAARTNHPVVVVTDCGCQTDDQFALAWLLKNGDIDVKGVIASHAPNLKDPAASTKCAQEVVRLAGSRASVITGSPEALERNPRPIVNDASRFIIDIARGYSASNRLSVLVLAAATDLGSAILADAGLSGRIDIVAVGFDHYPKGGDPWNVKNDPAAWDIILNSSVPATIGGSAVCRQYLRTDVASVRQLTDGAGQLGEFLRDAFENWVNNNPDIVAQVASPQQWVLCDLVAPAALLGMTKSRDVQRPVLNTEDLTFTVVPSARTIRWITEVDRDKVFAALQKAIHRPSRSSR